MTRPLSRLPFFVGVTSVNIAIVIAALSALAFRPSGGGHLAVLIVVGALQVLWLALHARRFADAGRGPLWPVLMFLLAFGTFAISYLIIAALWSSPEVQREAFRTAGGISGSGTVSSVETSEMIIEGGRAIASVFGAAGALLLSGFLTLCLAFVAFLSGCFSVLALALSTGQARASTSLPGAGPVQGLAGS